MQRAVSMNVKRKLLKKCQEQLAGVVRDFQQEVDEAQKSANDYGMPKDRYDAYRAQLLRKRDMFAQQLIKVIQQVDLLKRIDLDRKCLMVEFGALVITSNQKLFISTGLGKIEMDGEIYYAISGAVPIFKAMKEKRTGEEFVFNGKKSKIIEIY